MPNISEVNRELVKAFNINLRFNSIAVTNLTVQNLHGKDHIVISFDKNMNSKQCMKYLNNMKEKIIKRSYKDEKAAGVSYNTEFFPFTFNTKHLLRDNKERKKFSVEIDEGVVFNLKCYLAKALVGDIKEKMGSKFGVERIKKSIYDTNFDRNSYLYCMLFHDKGLQRDFVDSFSEEIESYPNAPSNYLEMNGNLVYIRKSIFDDIEFIKDIIAYNASLECRYLQTPSAKNKTVDKLKYTIIDFIDRVADIPVRAITRTSYVNSKEDSVLIPLVQNGKFLELLTEDDAYNLSRVFDDAVVTKIKSHHLKNPYWSNNEVYAIDFSDVDIACCVLNKIIENSVINKDHELSIDPGLRFQALSPAQSPFNSPMHAGPSGLRTPPNQRKKDTDSGYDSNSPPKPKDSGARSSSGGPGPSTQLSEMEWESPGQGLVSVPQLDPLDVAGTSGGPLTRLSSTAVTGGVRETSSSVQSVGTVQNVQAGTSAWSQPINPWSSSASTAGLWSLPQIRPSSSKGANEGVQTGKSIWYASSSHSPDVEDVKSIFSVEPEKQQVSGECSEAKSKESESPKKHKGGFLCKERWLPLTNFSSFKRRSVERDTMYSSKSDLVYHVTKKPSVSKPFFSFPTRIKAKSNPPSGVTSPTHEGAPGGLKPLTSDKRKELRLFLSPELQKKLDSNSFFPEKERLLYLTHTPEGKRELSRSLCEDKESQLLRLAEAQLSSPANSSSKKVDRDSGFCSMSSPAVQHKGSVPSKVKECSTQRVKAHSVEHT